MCKLLASVVGKGKVHSCLQGGWASFPIVKEGETGQNFQDKKRKVIRRQWVAKSKCTCTERMDGLVKMGKFWG